MSRGGQTWSPQVVPSRVEDVDLASSVAKWAGHKLRSTRHHAVRRVFTNLGFAAVYEMKGEYFRFRVHDLLSRSHVLHNLISLQLGRTMGFCQDHLIFQMRS